MPDIDNDKTKESVKQLRERAGKIEQKWRDARGLTKGLHHIGNAKAAKRRKRAECPKEPKASVRFRRWREKQVGKMGPASKVRRIDPVTGEAMEVPG